MVEERVALVDLTVPDGDISELLERVAAVMRRGWFVLGPEVAAFESELAESVGCAHAVGVGSGTDALILSLRALGLGPGDEVIAPDLTAFPTIAAILEAGGTPVLVDVERDRPILDLPATLAAITPRTKAVILVHLYGVCGDSAVFERALRPNAIALIEDCAQAQGATLPSGAPVGSVGLLSAFSFYPTKNLGALGDGGAVVTNSTGLAAEIRALRSHGERGTRYLHEVAARNSRLDDVQASILRYKLARLPATVAIRRELSANYAAAMSASQSYVHYAPGDAPHLAVVRVPDRESFRAHLLAAGIETGIHYPLATSVQPASRGAICMPAPNARAWAEQCVSLPLYCSLSPEHQARVVEATIKWSR